MREEMQRTHAGYSDLISPLHCLGNGEGAPSGQWEVRFP